MDERGNNKDTIKYLELNGNENSPDKNFQHNARGHQEKQCLSSMLILERKKNLKSNNLSILLNKLELGQIRK